MNTFTRRVTKSVFVWTVAAGMAVPALAEKERSGVTMDETHIVVHPITKISTEDTKAINNILKKYDKSLYKLATYKDGKLKKTQGTLSDVYLDQAIASELSAAQAKGESNKTMQFTNPQRHPGNITNPQRHPGNITNPQRAAAVTNPQRSPGAPTNPQQSLPPGDEKAAKELLERLKPILQKYSRK